MPRKSSLLLLMMVVSPVFAEVPPGFDLQAHRGGRDRRPENTLAAFRYAAELGVTTLELDTAVTEDRVVVAAHDPRLNPNLTKNRQGRFISPGKEIFIKDLTLSELKTYTVGELKPRSNYYYKHREQVSVPGETIPTLREAFQLFREMGEGSIRFNIEIKTYPPFPEYTIAVDEFVDLVLELIRMYGMEERVTVQSFDWRSLRLVQQRAPEIDIACLTVSSFSLNGAPYNLQPGAKGASPWLAGLDYDEFGGIVPIVQAFGADIVAPYYREISQADVQEAHRAGLKIIPWTVNDEFHMQRLIDWGVDGIITDKPDVLKKLLEKND